MFRKMYQDPLGHPTGHRTDRKWRHRVPLQVRKKNNQTKKDLNNKIMIIIKERELKFNQLISIDNYNWGIFPFFFCFLKFFPSVYFYFFEIFVKIIKLGINRAENQKKIWRFVVSRNSKRWRPIKKWKPVRHEPPMFPLETDSEIGNKSNIYKRKLKPNFDWGPSRGQHSSWISISSTSDEPTTHRHRHGEKEKKENGGWRRRSEPVPIRRKSGRRNTGTKPVKIHRVKPNSWIEK